MKHGSEYARRVKRLFNLLIRKFGKPAAVDSVDPIEQLIIGILSACTSHAKAQAVFRRLRQQMVDLNELRVTPPMELAEAIGDSLPLAKDKAQRIVDALNAIRKRQDSLDLTFLRQRGRREAREYLESLEGVDSATAASVVLYSLGGHAIPVDELMLYILHKDEIVDSSADAAEVQGFLERHISAANAPAFVELMGRHVASARVPPEKLEELVHPAPPEPPPEVIKKAPVQVVAVAAPKKAAESKTASARKKPVAVAAPPRPNPALAQRIRSKPAVSSNKRPVVKRKK